MKKVFSTREFYLGSFLLCKGLRLKDIRRLDEGARREFVFEDIPERVQLVDEYWNGGLNVSAKSYAASIKELKNRLYTDS